MSKSPKRPDRGTASRSRPHDITAPGGTVVTADPEPAEPDAPAAPELAGTSRQRLLISAALVVVLVSILSSVMPGSVLKDDLLTVTRPILNVTGLNQAWGVFAPNPRPETDNVLARVDVAGGPTVEIPMPSGRLLDEYWDYRWAKYTELIGLDPSSGAQRASFALWAAGQVREQGTHPTRVTLVRRTTDNLPPGPGPDTGPTHDTTVFTATVNGS